MAGAKDPLPILIVGAGIAGLTLAQGLHKLSIPFKLFEKDASLTSRKQGYRIRLDEAAAYALRDVLPPDVWREFQQTSIESDSQDGGASKIDAFTAERGDRGAALQNVRRTDEHVWSVDRLTLRQVLLLGIEDHVVWGVEYLEYEKSDDGIFAKLADGRKVKGRLLVGAEGLQSRVRQQFLPELKPLDAEGRLIFGKTPLTSENTKKIGPELMKEASIVMDKSQGLCMVVEALRFNRSRLDKISPPGDYVYWVLLLHRDYFLRRGTTDEQLVQQSGEELKRLSLALTQTWSAYVTSILQDQDTANTSMIRTVTMPPDALAWQTDERVTLIGDAAHVMPPTGANGGSCGIQDSVALHKEFAKEGLTVDILQRFEQNMRERAEIWIRKSCVGGKMIYGMADIDQLKPIAL